MNYRKIKKNMHGFTLIEMLIVLVIIGILTIFSLGISNDQVQKVRNKTVKEAVLSERQSRYSRNLGSSSFSGIIYKHMDIVLSGQSNEIEIGYYTGNNTETSLFKNTYTNKFSIEGITGKDNENLNSVTLEYTPYRIACKIKPDNDNSEEGIKKVTFLMKVNDHENGIYCFEVKSNNCRLIEVPLSSCGIETF